MMSIRSRAPSACSEAVRNIMRANRAKDSTPELRLRRALHAAKLYYRKNRKPVADLRCTADVVFFGRQVAVFVDGCYWHGCPNHFTPPKTNTDWWTEKIQDNVARDVRNTQALEARGWNIMRFWEHELKTNELLAEAVEKIRVAVK